MVIKKTWFSYFTWGLFVAFLGTIVTMFWYLSGLLPDESRIALSAGLSVLTILAVCLVIFAVGRLVTWLRPRANIDPKILDIFQFIGAGVILLVSFIARIMYLSSHVREINDSSGLFEEAMIVLEDESDLEDLLSIMTTNIVSFFLRIAGNRIIVAAVVMAVLQVFMVAGFYAAVRLMSGRIAALVVAAVMGLMPVGYSRMLIVQNQVLFFAMFALEMMITAIYLHLGGKGVYKNWFWIPWYIAVGVSMGFVAYVDFATIILWIPMILSLFTKKSSIKDEGIRLLIVLGGFALMFVIMLMQEAGIADWLDTAGEFFSVYFQNTDAIMLFYIPIEDYPKYMVLVTMMSVVLVTFWRDSKRDYTSVWLLMFLISALVVPLFGPTRLNAQELLSFCYAVVTGVGLSCLATPPVKRMANQEMQAVSGYPYPPYPYPYPYPYPGMYQGQQPPDQYQYPYQYPLPGPDGQMMQPGAPYPVNMLPDYNMGLNDISEELMSVGEVPQNVTAGEDGTVDVNTAGPVPEGMVLPMGDQTDDGESRMRMPLPDPGVQLGLERDLVKEGEVNIMESNNLNQNMQPGAQGVVPPVQPIPGQVPVSPVAPVPGQTPEPQMIDPGQAEPELSKAAQKAKAKALKAQARAEAKVAKAAARAAKKAEKERRRMEEDDDDDDDVAAAPVSQPVPPPAQPVPVMQQTAQPEGTASPANQMAAQPAPVTPPAPTLAESALAANNRVPVTTPPNLIRNTSFNADGSDDFDFEIKGEDDFDI